MNEDSNKINQNDGMIDGSDLTILVLCYNEGNTILRTLNSINDLQLMGHTVLVSNNHSTDDSTYKINKALSSRVNYVLINPSAYMEMSEHFNYALSKVKTKYVYPIQGHHMALPDGPGSLLRTIKSVSEEPALICGCRYTLKGEHITSDFYFHREGIITPFESIPIFLSGNIAEFTSTIYDVEKIRSVGGFENKYHRTNNWQLNIKLAAIYPILYLRRYISIWSMPPANISKNSNRKAQIAKTEIPIMIQDMIARLRLEKLIKKRKFYWTKLNKSIFSKSGEALFLIRVKHPIKRCLMHVDGPSLKEVRALVNRWS